MDVYLGACFDKYNRQTNSTEKKNHGQKKEKHETIVSDGKEPYQEVTLLSNALSPSFLCVSFLLIWPIYNQAKENSHHIIEDFFNHSRSIYINFDINYHN